MTFHVGSKAQPSIVVAVEGSGLGEMQARQAAIQFARARYRIPDPIALPEHEAAVRLRRQVLAAHSVPMPDLNSHAQWWRTRDCVPCYDER